MQRGEREFRNGVGAEAEAPEMKRNGTVKVLWCVRRSRSPAPPRRAVARGGNRTPRRCYPKPLRNRELLQSTIARRRIMRGWIPQMAAIGIHVMRTCHTAWDNVEPNPGQWTWDALDKQMTFMATHHIEFGGILIGSVPWDKEHSKGLPVDNIPAWSNYVFHVVQHVGKRVKYWEVWNEPPNFIGPKQTAADYAKILVSAYDAAKAANPDCLVGLAAKSVHVNFIEQVIKAGGRDHFDFITLHPYEVLGRCADGAGTEALYMNIVPTVRKMLAAQNPAKTNVPIIFTELGYDAKKSPERQAEALVKAYTMGIAQGVRMY